MMLPLFIIYHIYVIKYGIIIIYHGHLILQTVFPVGAFNCMYEYYSLNYYCITGICNPVCL